MKESKIGKKYYPSQDPLLRLRQEMKLRNFSDKTIKVYIYYITDILISTNKNPKTIKTNDIRDYLEKMADKKMAASSLNLAYSAFKFYFEKILKRKFFINIPRAKKDKKLPVVLNRREIIKIFAQIKNVKHKLILGLMYSAGLRASEVVNICVGDFDFIGKILRVSAGKGKKDRMTILSPKIMKPIKAHIKGKNTKDLVFLNNRGGKLSVRTVQKIFSDALKKSGIQKNATCHSLRHSFATHLLENGIGIRYIQELLGHSRLETTQIYTKVATSQLKDIESPL